MRRWPDCLPTPSFPGFGLTPFDKTRRSEMEVGQARVRRTTFANADMVDMMWIMEDPQMGAFRAFWDDAPVSLAGDSDDLTGWNTSGVTLSLAGAAGPDDCGPTRLIEDSSTGLHQVSLVLPGLVHNDVDVVIYASVAAQGRSHAKFLFVDRAGADASAVLDLTMGSIVLTGGITAEVTNRGRGFFRVRLVVNTGTGVQDPVLRIRAQSDVNTQSYAGDGASGIRLCEVSVAVAGKWNLFVRSDAAGNALGADGGAGWVLIPLATGGGFQYVEGRFKGPFKATGGKGLNWTVTASVEARYA